MIILYLHKKLYIYNNYSYLVFKRSHNKITNNRSKESFATQNQMLEVYKATLQRSRVIAKDVPHLYDTMDKAQAYIDKHEKMIELHK